MPLASPLPDPVVELYYSGAWRDISADVVQDGVTITYGAGGDPASMTLTLLNTDGTYSPRNPTSPLYGLIGRNTPIRCSVAHGAVRNVQTEAADFWDASDTTGLSVTGDLDLRIDIDPLSWRPTVDWWLGCYKAGAYGLSVWTDGRITINWYTATINSTVTSTVPVPGSLVGRKAVRVALDVDDGAGGHRADFYTANPGDLSGAWTLFDSVTESGTTSIDDTATSVLTYVTGPCQVYAVQIRDGIGGTVVAWPDFEAEAAGTTSIADDGYGNTWTANGDASVTNRWYRFWGEVSSWPQRWGKKGAPTVHSPIQCASPLRRLSQGASPVQSPMRRGSATVTDLEAYWPLEDGVAADTLTVVTGIASGQVVGAPKLAAYDGFAASGPIPTVESGRLVLPVSPAYANTGEWQVRFLARIPAATPDGAVLARMRTSSTLSRIDLIYTTGGNLYLRAYNRYDVQAIFFGTSFGVDDKDLRISVECKQNGPNVDLTMATIEAGETTGLAYGSTTGGAVTLGAVTSVDVNPDRAALVDFAVGHVTVQSSISSLFDLSAQLRAYRYEEADARMARLATENGVWLEIPGGGSTAQQMGEQGQSTLLDLFRDAANVDGGLLFEPSDDYALQYRTLASLYAQDPAVAFAYQDNLLRPFEPIEDDQQTRNKVTVTRAGGAAATAEDVTGRLGTQPPPDGIGIYDEAVTLSLAVDEQAIQQASWRVHLGTIDEARWPSIGVDLADSPFLTDADLTRDILGVGVGDRITVTNLPAWLPPDDVDQVVIGWSETITPYHWEIVWTCLPASAYRVAVWDDGWRWDSETSTLAAGVTSGATSLTVAVGDGTLWDDADGPFDIAVGGEVMTVTAVSGTSSPQTFTVTRSVNSVVKAHSSGDQVRLAAPSVWSL